MNSGRSFQFSYLDVINGKIGPLRLIDPSEERNVEFELVVLASFVTEGHPWVLAAAAMKININASIGKIQPLIVELLMSNKG